MRDACKSELRFAGFPSFTVFRVPWKEGRGVTDAQVPSFRVRALACRLGTVLNILCLLRNEGFHSFRLWASLFLCIVSEGPKGRAGTTF